MEHVFLDQRVAKEFRQLLLEMGNPLPDQFLSLKGKIGAVVLELDKEVTRFNKYQALQADLEKRKGWDRRVDRRRSMSARAYAHPGKTFYVPKSVLETPELPPVVVVEETSLLGSIWNKLFG